MYLLTYLLACLLTPNQQDNTISLLELWLTYQFTSKHWHCRSWWRWRLVCWSSDLSVVVSCLHHVTVVTLCVP